MTVGHSAGSRVCADWAIRRATADARVERLLPVRFAPQPLQVAVATGATCDTADKVLASIELGGCFDEIVSGYEVPCNKPAPDVYLLAAERLRLEPHECLAIEDSRARPFVAGAEEERGGQYE